MKTYTVTLNVRRNNAQGVYYPVTLGEFAEQLDKPTLFAAIQVMGWETKWNQHIEWQEVESA